MLRSLTIALAVAGCVSPPLLGVTDSLRVQPAALDLGEVALGSTASLELSVTNVGPADVSLTLAVAAPFSVAAELEVPGGATRSVRVLFTPETAGPVEGALAPLDVRLTGTGVAACAQAPCHSAAYDPASGACVDTVLPDGTACSTDCLTGTCRAGTCTGAALDCDDGNACTVDACVAATGCTHIALDCPSSPCMRATCDLKRGCGLEPRDDGTACGSQTCASAEVCIAGACERKARPDAARQCHYRELIAGQGYTCATNLAGEVRCWGVVWDPSNTYAAYQRFDDLAPSLAMPPTRLPRFSGTVALTAGEEGASPCAADSLGAVHCASRAVEPSRGNAPSPKRIAIHERVPRGWVLSHGGELAEWTAGGPLTAVAGVSAVDLAVVSGELCLLFSDAGVECNGVSVPFPIRATKLTSAVGRLLAQDDAGAVWSAQQRRQVDGGTTWPTQRLAPWGVVAIGGVANLDQSFTQGPDFCLAKRGGIVECTDRWGDTCFRSTVPGEVVALTGNGDMHFCALSDSGDIWCWGDNRFGQLSEPGVRPVTPLPLAATGVTSFLAGTVAIENGRLLGWGDVQIALDGQLRWSDENGLARTDLGAASGFRLEPSLLLVDADDALYKYDFDLPLTAVIDTEHRPIRVQRCGVGVFTGGRSCRTLEGGTVYVPYTHLHDNVPKMGCELKPWGEVTCLEGSGAAVTVPLAANAVDLSVWSDTQTGCARLETEEVACWESPHGPAVAVPGVSWPVRAVVGLPGSGCALSGAGTVQCWGDNFFGQLGRDGPASALAVTVPFDERVTELHGTLGRFGAPAVVTTLCARLASGKIACWGSNFSGEYAPPRRSSFTPLQVVR